MRQDPRRRRPIGVAVLVILTVWAASDGVLQATCSADEWAMQQPGASDWIGQATWAQVGATRTQTNPYPMQSIDWVPVSISSTGNHVLVIITPPKGGGMLDCRKVKASIDGVQLETAGMLMASAEGIEEMRKSGKMEVVACGGSREGLQGWGARLAYAVLFKLPPTWANRPGTAGTSAAVDVSGIADSPPMRIRITDGGTAMDN